jgi:capsid protein
MTATVSPILDATGKPFVYARPIRATYDAARSNSEIANHWSHADSLDSDSSNSQSVRKTLVARSRYEVANNGYTDGIVQTFATDLVGHGPRLKLGNTPFAQTVEKDFAKWAKEIKLRRKLWTMAHAKVQDGEAFSVTRMNPRMRHAVKLDLVLVETEQVSSPLLPYAVEGHIDGIAFDQFGNALWYDILKYHPGGRWFAGALTEAESVPAKFVTHWFLMRRPGQNRAVPEFRSTLNTGASARRWREATLGAAETAADISVLLSTTLNPNEIDAADPMSTIEFQKRMMTALPMGYSATQMRSEHPNATYETFHKSLVNEQARPKSMPYNKAACDSSSYNYASGRLDHQTYYASLDVEREDCNDLVLEKLFALYWQEAVYANEWYFNGADPSEVPEHTWDWPKHPVADVTSEASAADTRLKNGSLSLSSHYSEQGLDFQEEVIRMANDYGVTVQRMREILLFANLNAQNQQASIEQAKQGAIR